MVLEKNISAAGVKRNYGVDLLRICSMLMVVLLHILGAGGILFEAEKGSGVYIAAWLLEMIAFPAINCYGLISGYVGVSSRYKYTNLVLLWLQVAFYSVLITVFFYLRYPDVIPFQTVKDSFYPISNNFYWYFTAYAGMYLFIPIFNNAVNSLTKNQLKAILTGLFIAFCVLPMVFDKDIFLTGWGYSLLWLSFLYITGAYIKKYGFFKNNMKLAIGLYVLCTIASWLIRLREEALLPSDELVYINDGLVTQYSSPTMFLAAVALVVIFVQLNLPRIVKKIVAVVSPCSFGVYLIHVHPQLWDRLIWRQYIPFVDNGIIGMVLSVIIAAVCLFALLAAIDWARLLIFKILNLKLYLTKAENKLLGNLWG